MQRGLIHPALRLTLASGFSKGLRHCSSRRKGGASVAAEVQALAADLEANGVPEPQLSAAHLTAAVLGDGNLFSRVATMHGTVLDDDESSLLQNFANRRKVSVVFAFFSSVFFFDTLVACCTNSHRLTRWH